MNFYHFHFIPMSNKINFTGEKLDCANQRGQSIGLESDEAHHGLRTPDETSFLKSDEGHEFRTQEAKDNPNKIGNVSKPSHIHCRQACRVQKNQIQMSYTQYPSRGNFFHQMAFCLVASHLWQISCQNENRRFFLDQSYPELCKILKEFQMFFNTNATCNEWPEVYFENNPIPNQTLFNELYEYGKENLALVHVAIQSPYLTKIKREQAITLTSYVANTGGLLGLCLGFSFISGVEILYWCFCICCRRFF